MGFIDWHGKKGDHYEEVVEYAKTREEMDGTQIRGAAKNQEVAAFFGVPEFAALATDDILKCMIRIQKELSADLHSLAENFQWTEIFDQEQLIADFWLYMIWELLDQSRLPDGKKIKMLQVFMTGIFKIKNKTSAEEHCRYIQEDKEYQEYMRDCFALESGRNTLFWQWLSDLEGNVSVKGKIPQLLEEYQKFIVYLAYYLNQIIPGPVIGRKNMERKRLHETIIRNSIRSGFNFQELHKQLENPLYLEIPQELPVPKEEKEKRPETDGFALMKHVRILVKDMSVLDMGNVDEMKNAGLLYKNFAEKIIEKEKIASIYPAEAMRILREGKLPQILQQEGGLATAEEEILHYMEHAILYQQVRKDNSFRTVNGTFYITNERIYFHAGNKSVELKFAVLDKVFLYDLQPEILELRAGSSGLLFQTADPLQTYQVLKLIMNIHEKPEEAKLPLEQLTLDHFIKADLDTYIFSLREYREGNMTAEMKENMDVMIEALENLEEALKKFPGQRETAHSFLSYYIPETMRLIYSYQEYAEAGVSEEQIDRVHDRVMESIQEVKEAAEQRVDALYKMSAMDTVARAEALETIMRQDGYIKNGKILKL